MLSFLFIFLKFYTIVELLDDVGNLVVARLELHSLYSLFSASFAVFLVRSLARVFFAVIPQYHTFFRRMSRDVQHPCVFPGRLVGQTFCMFSLALADVALLGFGRQGGSSSPFPLL